MEKNKQQKIAQTEKRNAMLSYSSMCDMYYFSFHPILHFASIFDAISTARESIIRCWSLLLFTNGYLYDFNYFHCR